MANGDETPISRKRHLRSIRTSTLHFLSAQNIRGFVETNKHVMNIINKWYCHILRWRRSPKAFENKATASSRQTRSSHSSTLHFTQQSRLRFVCPFTTFSRSIPNRTRFGFRLICTSGSLFSASASTSFSNVELLTSSNLHPISSLCVPLNIPHYRIGQPRIRQLQVTELAGVDLLSMSIRCVPWSLRNTQRTD